MTFSYAAEWAPWLGHSVVRVGVLRGRMRATGSLKFHTADSPKVAPCPDCKGIRYDLGGPHATQVTKAGLIDCVGRLVK